MTAGPTRHRALAILPRTPLRLATLMLTCLVLGRVDTALATAFDDQVAAFEQAGNQSEAMVTALLKTAIDEHREAEGVAAVRTWLSANTSSSPTLLFYVGQALLHSGEWSDALVFYRKLLADTAIDPGRAALVVPQTYRLLINDMRDTESAYLFMRAEGIRLRQYGRVSQFDHWFMREAQRRNDIRSLAERLAAIHANPKENPDPYAGFMATILTQLEHFEPLPDATAEAIEKLVAVVRNEPRLKPRLDWNKAAIRYGQDLATAGNSSQEQLDALLVETHPAARALLAVEPQEGAKLIIRTWQHHSGTRGRNLYAQRELKAQPFLDALQHLPPEQGKVLLKAELATRSGPIPVARFITPATARLLVPRFPSVFNADDAPAVALWDKDMTVETARELAPHLLRNPQGDAALIRAMAATGTRETGPLLDAMMKTEIWRFADAGSMVKMVWDSGLARTEATPDTLRDKIQDTFNKQQATVKKPTAPDAGLPPAGPSAQPVPTVADPAVVSRELLALPTNASPLEVEAALNTVLQRASQAPELVAVHGLQPVAASLEWTGNTRKLVMTLFGQHSPLGGYPRGQGYGQLAERLLDEAQKSGNWGEIVPYVSAFWRAIDDDTRNVGKMVAFAEAAHTAGESSVALAVARIGLQGKFAGVDPNDTRSGGQARAKTLHALAGSASTQLGIAEIPVDATHPAYALFQSNAAFLRGNQGEAWKLYTENSALLTATPDKHSGPSLLRQLSVDYVVWLLTRTIEDDRTDAAETIFSEITKWAREQSDLLSLQQDAELKLAYAGIALRRGALPAARAWYRQVADASEFEGSEMQLRAALGSITIDRMSRDFGAALKEIDSLLHKNIPESQTRLHYARAEVLMEQEAYKEAMNEVDDVLRREPAHADAMILRGQIQIQMRRLVEATEVEIGITRANKVMVPGEVLKINLLDPTLSVSGVGTDIEVDVWTKSGDREQLMLHQLGDDVERFRAEISTALGPSVPGDKTLQVLGDDEIRFGYSQRFRAKMKKLPPDPGTVITIATDAQLAFSAGALPPRAGEREIPIEELSLSSAQRQLGTGTVRPGNPVFLRVIDPDQSKTKECDEIPVRVEVSSGDVIRRFMLKETGPYTGEFTGMLPTAGAQAMAFASESATGRDPNMSISAENYPGWLGNAGDKETARTFGIDFNDNVALNTMTMQWLSDEAALTHFVLQMSLNGRDWETRARYPSSAAPWDGHPRVSSFAAGPGGITVSSPTGRSLPPDWEEHMTITSIRPSCTYLESRVPGLAAGKPPLVQGPGNQMVLMQFRALFYQSALATRRFKLTGGAPEDTIFLIDGQPSGDDPQEPLMITREFQPGLHDLQVWRRGTREALLNSSPVLLCTAEDSDAWEPCPDNMFDPATFPAGVQVLLPQPASITNVAGGVSITFGDQTQARIIRLAIHGFQGVAPGIGKVTAQGRDGKTYLPVAQDFMALRDNAQLEVLPRDQIVAFYEDTVSATPGRTSYKSSLGVAFNTATISASFLSYGTTEKERHLQLSAIRRFNLGDAIAVVIDDVDMDSSTELDQVDFVAVTSDGAQTKLKAIETEPHSGRFIGRIFPVEGKPQRDSELQVSEGGTLTFIYRDMENLDPGIPTDRRVTIEHAKYMTPRFGVFTTQSEPLPDAYVRPVTSLPVVGVDAEKEEKTRPKGAPLQPRRTLSYHFVDESGLATTPLKIVIGASVRFDVVASHLALGGSSTINAYVQTDAGRAMAAADPERKAAAGDVPFDIAVPGTIKLTGTLVGGSVSIPQGYTEGKGSGPPQKGSPLDEGRFSFSVPLALGDYPVVSLATQNADSSFRGGGAGSLAVRAGDTVHIGFAWLDENKQPQWKTAALKVESHALLDVLDESYRFQLDRVFVGEKVFVQLLAPGLSRSAEREWATVTLVTGSGVSAPLRLRETGPHTGLFRGAFDITYANETLPDPLPPVDRRGLPVRYGDEVTVRYRADGEALEQQAMVAINMGADGAIEPFSKRFTGDEMAVKTSFTLAECYFELAKHHRKMDQESLARRQMAQGAKLLQEAMATHSSGDLQAHAEYLLANLSQEYADLAQNEQAKIPGYREALARFIKIPTDFPATEFADKSQFKIGLLYEKLGEGEIAVEEYVKLAYKYPKSEHIPEVMGRLGKHFQANGQAYKEQADPLREKDDEVSRAEVRRLDALAFPEFGKAATIYEKLHSRFPDHSLAGLAGLAAAQNHMRAQQLDKAMDGFTRVVANEAYDAAEIRAQALFWLGQCHERTIPKNRRDDPMGEAYRVYRRVTYDFPDSKWAKFARGRLADPAFQTIVEADEARRQELLKALEAQKHMGKDSAQQRTVDRLLKK